MRSIWSKITQLGLTNETDFSQQEIKRLMFYNRVLFIGIFATLFQIAFVWPYLKEGSLIFLFVCIALVFLLVLNSKALFSLSKWLYIFVIYGMGVLTTILVGGAALYHIQVLLIFASCLILFDYQKEQLQIVLGVPFIVLCILIGELGWFGAPDFSDHFWTPFARYANISSLFLVNTLFTIMIIRLNQKNEFALFLALEDITLKSKELKENQNSLEATVLERTSALQEQTDQLEKQNEEKEVLLKEVHHRVRNNLQVIISLINLQLAKDGSDETKNALREIQGRVESMSLVHQKMYQNSDFKNIQLKEYTEEIISNIAELYGENSVDSRINIPKDLRLKMEVAIPIGLIINEIVSNYFKHALPEASQFSLSIEDSSQQYVLRYQDNGKGFPEELGSQEPESLGLVLISNLTEQLDGELEWKNDSGAVYEIVVNKI